MRPRSQIQLTHEDRDIFANLTMPDPSPDHYDIEYESYITDRNDAAIMHALSIISSHGCRGTRQRLIK